MVRILDKSAFKALVAAGVDCAHQESVETLFHRYDVSRHDEARQLLLALAGASWPLQGAQDAGIPATTGHGLVDPLPTWSVVDEL